MTHDYSQYDDDQLKANDGGEVVTGLNFRAVCTDCEWENRRVLRGAAVRSKDGHERENPDHSVRVEEL